MQLGPILAVAAGAATTMARPLVPRDSAGCFSIADFRDGGSPHSVEAYISFTVSDTSVSPPLANVTCEASEAIQPSVATASFGTACSDPSVVFGLEYGGSVSGYYLTVAHAYNGNTTRDIGAISLGTDIETEVDTINPNGNYQYLNYSATFDIAYNRYG